MRDDMNASGIRGDALDLMWGHGHQSWLQGSPYLVLLQRHIESVFQWTPVLACSSSFSDIAGSTSPSPITSLAKHSGRDSSVAILSEYLKSSSLTPVLRKWYTELKIR